MISCRNYSLFFLRARFPYVFLKQVQSKVSKKATWRIQKYASFKWLELFHFPLSLSIWRPNLELELKEKNITRSGLKVVFFFKVICLNKIYMKICRHTRPWCQVNTICKHDTVLCSWVSKMVIPPFIFFFKVISMTFMN